MLAQFARAINFYAAIENGRGINDSIGLTVNIAPASGKVKILQCQSGRIDGAMTGLTGWVLAVYFQSGTNSSRGFTFADRKVHFHVRRRWCRRCSEDAIQDP